MRDLLIVGGGPGGISAGIYSAIYKLNTIIVTKNIGGTILDAPKVENYPGLGRKNSQETIKAFKSHLDLFNVPIEEGEEVVTIRKIEKGFKVFTRSGKEYKTKAILIATGTQVRKLNVPGEDDFRGKGVSYCAVCDAPLFGDAVVGVVGGSDAAAKEALLLSEHAEKVYLIYRGKEIHPEPILKKRIMKKVKEGKIEVINNANVKEILGKQMMEKIKLDKEHAGTNELELEGLFIAIGGVPLTEITRDVGIEVNKMGAIVINEKMETNVEGIYAAGDVTNNNFKQIITAAYQGSKAIKEAYAYINSK